MTAMAALLAQRAELLGWLKRDVLPFWGNVGVDLHSGGFFEKITPTGLATGHPRRARVVGRQIYAFSQAGRLGWNDDESEAIVKHGLRSLDLFYNLDGGIHATIGADGTILRAEFDLYDYAFVLFGLAAAVAAFPWAAGEADRALALREHIESGWRHPVRGFEEARPRRLPLKANPHMHMLESCLAWEALQPSDPGWAVLADEIAELALDHFVCRETGALREFYDGNWAAAAGDEGRLVEPGHQCEWGWLLSRWGGSRGRTDAMAAAKLLITTAERHGVDQRRGVMINELYDDLSKRDAGARLWPQTERIKAWIAMFRLADSDADLEHAVTRTAAAVDGLLRFRRDDPAGSYYDWMEQDGSMREENAPASSLYHIVCAACELQTAFGDDKI